MVVLGTISIQMAMIMVVFGNAIVQEAVLVLAQKGRLLGQGSGTAEEYAPCNARYDDRQLFFLLARFSNRLDLPPGLTYDAFDDKYPLPAVDIANG